MALPSGLDQKADETYVEDGLHLCDLDGCGHFFGAAGVGVVFVGDGVFRIGGQFRVQEAESEPLAVEPEEQFPFGDDLCHSSGSEFWKVDLVGRGGQWCELVDCRCHTHGAAKGGVDGIQRREDHYGAERVFDHLFGLSGKAGEAYEDSGHECHGAACEYGQKYQGVVQRAQTHLLCGQRYDAQGHPV